MFAFKNHSNQYILKFRNNYIFTLSLSDDRGWVRFFNKGIGLGWKHESFGLTFSQRIGKRKHTSFLNYIFYPLEPYQTPL